MATPTRTTVNQTYLGDTIQCARIYCPIATSFKLRDVCRISTDYVFQAVIMATTTQTITVKLGNVSKTMQVTSSFQKRVLVFPDVDVSESTDAYIDFPSGTYYLWNVQIEQASTPSGWRPAPEDAEEYADKASHEAVASQTQADIFNKLTNNGEVQGLYLQNGKVYINASYIKSGTIEADYIHGGTLSLGGDNNVNGNLYIYNSNGENIGGWSKDGIQTKVLTATDYVYIDGAVGSYMKLAPYNTTERYVEIKASNSLFHICGPNGTPHIFALVRGTSLLFCVGMDTPEEIEAQTGTKKITSIQSGSMLLADNSGSEMGYTLNLSTNGFYVTYKSESQNYIAVECNSNRIITQGTKNRIVDTDQYGNRLYYCYETSSPMFGDVGEGKIGEDGIAYIWIDPIIAETISGKGYQVFLQKYGEGDIHVKERKEAYFVVEGEPNLSFGWEIKGKQIDYDQVRLEKLDVTKPEKDVDYGEQAVTYMNELHKGRLSA